jgi:hypothetical protein
MTVNVYKVTDTFGTSIEGVVKETNETLFISGLKDKKGIYQVFESEAYHLPQWVSENGFILESHLINLDLNTKGVITWKKT